MDHHTTPGVQVVTAGVTKDVDVDDDVLAAVIGGVFAVLLVLVCLVVALFWCLSRQKGSYVTNELSDDDEDEDESDGSDTVLRREPLKAKDEE